MPALAEVAAEIQAAAANGDRAPHDTIRRRHLERLAKITGNHAVAYATCFIQKPSAPPITGQDVQGFMNILSGADKKKGLDLILHSHGGSAEAAEGIADYLHQHFAGRRIRVIVPYMAMSAATMLACAGDSVVMGDHSSLGPVDPQLTVMSGGEPCPMAAHSVVNEFGVLLGKGPEHAEQWILNALSRGHVSHERMPELYGALAGQWARAVLARFDGMGVIDQCLRQMALSEKLICIWLSRRMFADVAEPARGEKAGKLAEYLADHDHFLSHERRVSSATARENGMAVERLEENKEVQDAVLSVFHALTLTFSDTRAVKIIESDAGRSFVRMTPPQKSP